MSAVAIGGLLLQGIKTWFSHRKEVSEAKQERRVTEIKEGVNLQNGWKDEYLTVTFTAPVWMILWGSATNNPELVKRTKEAVVAIGSLPEWYQLILGTIVLGSFGLRGYREWKAYRSAKNGS